MQGEVLAVIKAHSFKIFSAKTWTLRSGIIPFGTRMEKALYFLFLIRHSRSAKKTKELCGEDNPVELYYVVSSSMMSPSL